MITKETIKNSLDAKWRKRQIIMYCSFLGVAFFIEFIFSLFTLLKENGVDYFLIPLIISTTFFLIILAPFIIYSISKYRSLFKDLENYHQYEVTLDKPETSYWYRGAVYYTVSFETVSNKKVTIDTNPLWSSFFTTIGEIKEYNNKKVDILYNENLDSIIVLGLQEKNK